MLPASILNGMFDQLCSYHYPTLDSTNKHAKRCLQRWRRDTVTLITADTQTHGYGRFGRQWSSFASNLHCTYLYPLPQLPCYVANLAQVTALATARAIASTCCLKVELKWPNDLMFNGSKLGGILVETAAVDATGCFLIIGIGLNVNSTTKQLANVGQPAASLFIATGYQQCRQTLLHSLTDHLMSAMSALHQYGFEYFHSEYTQLLTHRIGDALPFKHDKQISSGSYYGIAANGALMLSDSNGHIITLYSNFDDSFK